MITSYTFDKYVSLNMNFVFQTIVHCSPIEWNHPNGASVLCGLARYYLTKLAPFKHKKWTHYHGDSTRLANSVCACMYVWLGFRKCLIYLCSISFATRVIPAKHSIITHIHSDYSVTLAFLCCGLVCAVVVFSSESLRATSVSVQSHYCPSACGEVVMDHSK